MVHKHVIQATDPCFEEGTPHWRKVQDFLRTDNTSKLTPPILPPDPRKLTPPPLPREPVPIALTEHHPIRAFDESVISPNDYLIPPPLPKSNAATALISPTPAQRSMGQPIHVDNRLYSINRPGFWRRTGAYLVDIFITAAIAWIGTWVWILAGSFQDDPEMLGIAKQSLPFLLGILFSWLYTASFECSPTQATLGKMLFGFKVTNMAGSRITFGRATGRYLSRLLLGTLTLRVEYLFCVWTQKKQCLHDMAAGCLMEDTVQKNCVA